VADVNAQSIEEFSDRVVYRFIGGRYQQAVSTMSAALNTGLKTLVNTDTTRNYIIPRSGTSARFYKVELNIFCALQATEAVVIGACLVPMKFFRVVMSSLLFDGKSLTTDFFKESNENIIASSYLRNISIRDIQMEPVFNPGQLQQTALSQFQFTTGAGTTALYAIVQPTVTFYKK